MEVNVFAFAQLFAGRADCYGRGGDDAGCVREPVDNSLFERHLAHYGKPIGIYPITDRNTCWWGCADIDDDDRAAARALAMCLKAMGITAWIEISRSKGYHVWVFAERETPARVMRRAMLVAYDTIGLPVKECNPKQETLPEGGVGNYVRLPYPQAKPSPAAKYAAATGQAHTPYKPLDRQIMIDEHGAPIPLDEFTDAAFYHRTPDTVLHKWAALWTPHPTKGHPHIGGVVEFPLRTLLAKLPPLPYTVWRDGPLEGRDRSNTLSKLAHLLFESRAVSADEALAILTDADTRWGKFANRADGEQQLAKIIEGAWA